MPVFLSYGVVICGKCDGPIEAERSIMWSKSCLPYLTASNRSRNREYALREEGQIRRTRDAHPFSGVVGRRKLLQKFTVAHSESRSSRTAQGYMLVHYEPRAFSQTRRSL